MTPIEPQGGALSAILTIWFRLSV